LIFFFRKNLKFKRAT